MALQHLSHRSRIYVEHSFTILKHSFLPSLRTIEASWCTNYCPGSTRGNSKYLRSKRADDGKTEMIRQRTTGTRFEGSNSC
eukprot:1147437-Pelagomonas_calceolata.AAC.2